MNTFSVTNKKWIEGQGVDYEQEVILYDGKGDLMVRWYMLDGKESPHLEVYSDAFDMLFTNEKLVKWFASQQDKDFTVEELVAVLKDAGFQRYGRRDRR